MLSTVLLHILKLDHWFDSAEFIGNCQVFFTYLKMFPFLLRSMKTARGSDRTTALHLTGLEFATVWIIHLIILVPVDTFLIVKIRWLELFVWSSIANFFYPTSHMPILIYVT